MRLYDLSRTTLVLASMCCMLGAQTGCGRSHSSGSSNPTPTRTSGGVPTPTPTPVLIENAGANLSDVIKNYPGGGTFIISPGTYQAIDVTGADVTGPLTLQADETGAFTGRPGTITILGQGRNAAISLDGINNVVIEGVSTIGGTRASILIANGNQIVLLHNRVRQAAGDGIRIERSSGVLVFDNLIYANGGTGLTARGVNTMESVNNTVHGNAGGGISYLRLQFEGGSAGSPFGFVLNNIIDSNSVFGLRVDDSSNNGFSSNYNINNDGYVGVSAGNRDLIADPLFLFPASGGDANFRLQSNVGVGGSPAIDRGDPATEDFFVSSLSNRTTNENNYRDVPPVDLGYHYPNGIDTPTPVPTFTPRGTQQPRATSTPTFTPTFTPTATNGSQSSGQTGPVTRRSSGSATGDSDTYGVVPTPTATATPDSED